MRSGIVSHPFREVRAFSRSRRAGVAATGKRMGFDCTEVQVFRSSLWRESSKEGRDGDDGDDGGDQDGARGTFDVGIVLFRDDKDVSGYGKGSADDGDGCPEGIYVEELGSSEPHRCRVNEELEEAHIGGLGYAGGDGEPCEGCAEGEEGAGAGGAAEEVGEVLEWGREAEARGCEEGAGEDRDDKRVADHGAGNRREEAG